MIWLPLRTTEVSFVKTGMNLGPPHMRVNIYDGVLALQDFNHGHGAYLRMGCHFSIISNTDFEHNYLLNKFLTKLKPVS